MNERRRKGRKYVYKLIVDLNGEVFKSNENIYRADVSLKAINPVEYLNAELPLTKRRTNFYFQLRKAVSPYGKHLTLRSTTREALDELMRIVQKPIRKGVKERKFPIVIEGEFIHDNGCAAQDFRGGRGRTSLDHRVNRIYHQSRY